MKVANNASVTSGAINIRQYYVFFLIKWTKNALLHITFSGNITFFKVMLLDI